MTAVLVTVIVNFDSLLTPVSPSYLRWLLPGLILLAAVTGMIWGMALRTLRPDVYHGIGTTVGKPSTPTDSDYVPTR